jgi:hypothetical protein
MNGPERFAASNLPLYGHRRATGNHGFTTGRWWFSFGNSALGVPAAILSVPGDDARMQASVSRILLGFDPVASPDAAGP